MAIPENLQQLPWPSLASGKDSQRCFEPGGWVTVLEQGLLDLAWRGLDVELRGMNGRFKEEVSELENHEIGVVLVDEQFPFGQSKSKLELKVFGALYRS
jgi:hypothetical protein